MQEFTAPVATSYKIECWGASGGINEGFSIAPGKGGYTSGKINLSNNTKFYLYVGQSTVDMSITYAFNGGGGGEAPGGGATDVRLVGGEWNNFGSLKSRIMVAGGGGGGFYISSNTTNRESGHAGGLSGISANCIYLGQQTGYSGEGGFQTRGGSHGSNTVSSISGIYSFEHANGNFGYGGYGTNGHGVVSSGGGGGYYGGGHGVHPGGSWTGGGGGSSSISGYTGCDAISESSTEDNIVHTGLPNHYSGYVFNNPVMIDGATIMPSPSGEMETGHSGNGYCIITWQQLPQ